MVAGKHVWHTVVWTWQPSKDNQAWVCAQSEPLGFSEMSPVTGQDFLRSFSSVASPCTYEMQR